MVTKDQLTQGLELTDYQTTTLFELIENNKVASALHLAADLLNTDVQALADATGKERLSFVQMSAEDVTTLMYDHDKAEFFLTTLTTWLKENEDTLPKPEDADPVSDAEPYVMFYWPNGDMLATQIDGMKEIIEEHGQPERYEIVKQPLNWEDFAIEE